ncbi:zinc finger BED domain-containing protein RICESLEEPER 2-like protein [Tanacetum coccineum]
MATQGSSSITGVGSSSAPTILEILPCKRNPEIWCHYNLCRMSDNTQKDQCMHCFNFYSMASNSTLKAHFTHPHCVALKTTLEPSQPSMGRDGSVFVYNPDYLREQFAGLVISRGLPFNHFDHEETTTVFQNTMLPRYNHVSRLTLKRDAMKLWATAKQLIIDGFLNLNARFNITTGVWSAGHGLPGSYLCVTAHWIEPSTWQMMKRVIAFEDFQVPHTGGRLARMLRNTFVRFNLEDKVLSITLDNASNNTSAIDKLKLKYEPPMEGRFYHSRCVAHIINLVVQEGLKVKSINAIKESFKTMLKDVFKSGGTNYSKYIRICREADKPAYSSNWDVPTRWNSTYHVFQSGLKQKATLMYFHDVLANKGECNHFPVDNWIVIESLCPLLEVFSNATKFLSGVYYPTSPLVLQQIYFISCKLTEYELNGGIFRSMVKPMKAKLKKYFEKMTPIITCAAALNPCFNVHGVELLIEDISANLEFFDDSHATKEKNGSTTLWKELMFPVLSRMAMDVLSVQATSVASESAFSTSGRVLSIRRTKLTPSSLEMCMCLKDHLDAQKRKQHISSLEGALDFEEEILTIEVQDNEATPLSDEEITLDAASQGTMASGSGGEEPEFDYDLTHNDIDD